MLKQQFEILQESFGKALDRIAELEHKPVKALKKNSELERELAKALKKIPELERELAQGIGERPYAVVEKGHRPERKAGTTWTSRSHTATSKVARQNRADRARRDTREPRTDM